MQEKFKQVKNKVSRHRITLVLRTLLRDEAISGKIILAAAALALIFVNSPLASYYQSFWQTNFSIGFGSWSLSEDLRHWVNDGLMAIFFLVVGLEVKREIVRGELSNVRIAALPVAAAVGGMVVPAAIYFALNPAGDSARGWGIPIATDIAFAVGVLALLGSKVPSSLRFLLLSIAIVDDILAIAIIAIFYATGISIVSLATAAVILLVILAAKRFQPSSLTLFVLLGIALWIALQTSGVHAAIAGALLGFLAPLSETKHRLSVGERLEKALIPFSTFIVVPLFAFANAGIVLSFTPFTSEDTVLVMLGIFAGLIAGKTLGIFAGIWLITRLKFSRLPRGVSWRHINGLGLLAGIGFTVSIFITDLAFESNGRLIVAAKMSIIISSIVAAILGMLVLRASGNKKIS